MAEDYIIENKSTKGRNLEIAKSIAIVGGAVVLAAGASYAIGILAGRVIAKHLPWKK